MTDESSVETNEVDETLMPGRSIEDARFAPYFLTVISNKYFGGVSRALRAKFSVGLNEWRLLSALRNRPGDMAQRISEALGMSKSIISRSSRKLINDGYAVEKLVTGERRLWLTKRGVVLHDQIIKYAVAREAKLLDGLSGSELDVLFQCFSRMVSNLEKLEELDRDLLDDKSE